MLEHSILLRKKNRNQNKNGYNEQRGEKNDGSCRKGGEEG
jgi:hypothetical protein